MRFVYSVAILILLNACGSEHTGTPRPRAYPQIEFPVKSFDKVDNEDCPFIMEKPSYSDYIKDTLYFDEKPLHPCWFDLAIKPFNGAVHFSYYPISSKSEFEKLVNDAHKLSGKHNRKANYIDEKPFDLGNNVSGIVFEMEGPVASPLQFFLTDSTNHFLRASLYFESRVDRDSIKPIYEFVRADILQMIEGFRWKD